MDGEIRALIARWAGAWGVPDLERDVSVSFSSRLTRSLGRCRPSAGRITLRSDLRLGSRDRLAEVLCHEVAHVAAFRLFGPGAAPHGPEWQGLLAQVGFEPRVRTTEPTSSRARVRIAGQQLLPGGSPAPARVPLSEPTRILPYEHRCPVCQSVRFARRPVPRWRCAECLEAGLSGELVITRHQRLESSQ
ncbi:MAG TPA: SprT family zinc-dependent metalloprotease [Longimicrobiaceae bacterium]|nr:SprT family zinc-dependent metalloprotease [Longimicrobiaceae bacterium]